MAPRQRLPFRRLVLLLVASTALACSVLAGGAVASVVETLGVRRHFGSPKRNTTGSTGPAGAAAAAPPGAVWRRATCSREAGCTTTRCRCTTRRAAPSWRRSSTARSTAAPTSSTSSTGGVPARASSRGNIRSRDRESAQLIDRPS